MIDSEQGTIASQPLSMQIPISELGKPVLTCITCEYTPKNSNHLCVSLTCLQVLQLSAY